MSRRSGQQDDDAVDPFAVRLLYSPHVPHPRQHAFLLLGKLDVLEAFYGGAGGGGKSDALLMAALEHVDVPGYAAIILRKTMADLNLPGSIMARAREWLAGTDASWNGNDSRFTFPSGATLSFGYLQTRNDKFRYAGAEFQYIAFDELTTFPEDDYQFLFSRLRRPTTGPLSTVPLRMRSASNPGNRGHAWVRRRLVHRQPAPLVDGQAPDPLDTPERAARRAYVPALAEDNPSLDLKTYEESLAAMDPTTRAQIRYGDWDARPPGDWVYDHQGIASAIALGDELDAELVAGTIPPPDGGLLTIGIDWGEHSHALIGWPLEGGGLYVVAEVVGTSQEPTEFAARVIGRRPGQIEPGSGDRPVEGALDAVYALGARSRPGDLPPALPTVTDPLLLVEQHAFDAAGVQSMRSYMKAARHPLRHPRATVKSVPFGAPAPKSGAAKGGRSYKAEGIAYNRRLLRRAADGRRVGILAIGARCPELRRQLPELRWKDRDAGLVEKGDDHGPDALIPTVIPSAIRNR